MNNDDLKTIKSLKKFKIYDMTKMMVLAKEKGFKGSVKILKKRLIIRRNYLTQKITCSKNDIYIIYDKNEDIKELRKEENFRKIINENNFNVHYMKYISYYHKKTCNNNISYFDIVKNFYTKSFIYYSKRPKFNLDQVYNGISVKSKEEFFEIFNKKNSYKLFANYCNKNNVTARTTTFYNFKGEEYYSGGAERYLLDLHEILKEKGINMDIYQESDYPFFRKYRDVNVIGVPLKKQQRDYKKNYYMERCKKYNNMVNGQSQLHIYSAFFECYPFAESPSIGISHGVAWDNESNSFTDGIHFENDKKIIIDGAILCDKMISVDTNTANWFQTIDYKLGSEKIDVISNYVDTNEFKPREDYLKRKEKIIITYPRRLYGARGLYTLLNIVDQLIEKHDNIEIHFVGKGFDYDLNQIARKAMKYPGKVFCYSKDPKDMPEVYKMTDISVIPTKFSEGTSLSCLEAMASGNIVISTRIGGLTDLVIDGYNGYLIESNEDALFEALDDAITNYDKRLIYKERAKEVAEAFNKNKWKEKWLKVFKQFELTNKNSNNVEICEFFVKDFEKISDAMSEKIKEELRNNSLVYIRTKNNCEKYKKEYSGEMLQFIDQETETVLNEHRIYYEEEFVDSQKKEKIKI